MHNAPLQTNPNFGGAGGTPGPAPGPAQQPASPEMLAIHEQRVRKLGIGRVVIGLALFVIGVAVTAATYTHASSGGGTYVVAWGPIVFGPIVFLQGFITLVRVRKLKLTSRPAA